MRKIVTALIIALLAIGSTCAAAGASSLYVRTAEPPMFPSKTVVLTFDDGPSAYTLQIAAILQRSRVTATFFIVGNQALRYPSVLRQLYADGDEIGNHTFTHPDLETLPSWRIKEELNLNELIIIGQTGHETRLMRPPYLGSDNLSASSRDLIYSLEEQGYIVAGEDIDTGDWQKPGIAKIIKAATNGDGGVILMHDGGGNREQTVSALPAIISYYQSRGYHFMTVGQALGLSNTQVMPAPAVAGRIMGKLALGVFTLWSYITSASHWIIFVLIAASLGRLLLVLGAALVQSRRKISAQSVASPPVSVIVPAYNEAAVIAHCLHSVLRSEYSAFEVIVVDDGSSDETSVVASRINDPRLRVVRKFNGGKASALNYGIGLAQYDIVVAIDADTVFHAHTLQLLMRHFFDKRVGAVSGNTKIANKHRLITKLQSLEYIVGFNLDRRMGDLFDCITVVPGAIGAFRKSALEAAGRFDSDTLAEDTDLTLTIKELGYRIVYDPSAIAHTEAPATIKDLLKQRFRWTFGTMQAVWKHRRSFLNPKKGTLGMVGLPYLVFYQILFPLISPLFDIALILGLVAHRYELMIISLAVYTAADVMSSAIALWLDRESLLQLWILVPQRLFYRQLMYYVIIKSIYYVLRGRLVGWNKLKREGSSLAKAA